MPKIKLRYQRLSDAKRFYEILNNHNFKYFRVRPKSVGEEKKFLAKTQEKKKTNLSHNFSIIYKNQLVGAAGIRANQHRKYIGEIGYFIDEQYWGKGIALKTVKLLEKICFNKLKIKRVEIITDIRNRASIKVALKNRYRKEGVLRGIENHPRSYLFSKIQ